MKAWWNGRLVDAAEIRIDPTDRGFTLGDGVFETIAVRRGAAAYVDRHLARLADGLAVLGIPAPFPAERLAAALAELVAANALTDGALRLTVTRGPGARGISPPADPHPTVVVTAAAGAAPQTPVTLTIARSTCRNERSPLARIKSLNYLDNVLARREAAEHGADDAILLNTAGCVAETTVANLVALIDGALVTPPVEEGALPGVMRAAVIAHAGALERPLTLDDLERAEAVLLTNSLGIRAASLLGAPTPPTSEVVHRLRVDLC